MSLDDMMAFRVAYLKAISESWRDDTFKQKMIAATADGGGDNSGWQYLDRDITSPVLNDTNKVNNWDIDLHFLEDVLPGNGYHPELSGGWVGPRAVLTLNFPDPPTTDDQQAVALADYYFKLATPFGEIERHGTGGGGVSSGAGGNGMGHMSDALVLGGVIARSLALSWSSTEFKQQLVKTAGADALPVLANWLGYKCPWNVEIRVAFYGTGAGLPVWNDNDGVKKWDPKPRNALQMYLPNKPAGSPPYAIALAAYNQTGDQYPLTCP